MAYLQNNTQNNLLDTKDGMVMTDINEISSVPVAGEIDNKEEMTLSQLIENAAGYPSSPSTTPWYVKYKWHADDDNLDESSTVKKGKHNVDSSSSTKAEATAAATSSTAHKLAKDAATSSTAHKFVKKATKRAVKSAATRIDFDKKRMNIKKMKSKSDDVMEDVCHCCTFQTIIHICPIDGISTEKRRKKTRYNNNYDDDDEAEDLNEYIYNV